MIYKIMQRAVRVKVEAAIQEENSGDVFLDMYYPDEAYEFRLIARSSTSFPYYETDREDNLVGLSEIKRKKRK